MHTPFPASTAVHPHADAPARPGPAPLLHPVSLALPDLPDELGNLTLLHVSDLHVRKNRPRFSQLLETLADTEVDVVLLTGDFMTLPGDEQPAAEILRQIVDAARARRGIFGVWGNHDTPELRHRCADLPLRWLNNDAAAVEGLPLTILGLDCGVDECRRPEGCLRTALQAADRLPAHHHRILLAHVPNWLHAAADAGIALMLAGHTHGGQIRLPLLGPLINMTPRWPLRFTSGVVRHRDTFAVISRGLGESVLDGLRLNCPPHAPLITLRRDANPAPPGAQPRNIMPW